jgi:hypothetical protein
VVMPCKYLYLMVICHIFLFRFLRGKGKALGNG